MLPGLLDIFTNAVIKKYVEDDANSRDKSALRLMPSEVLTELDQMDKKPYHLLMNTADFVSGLTDRHAISLFRKIKGISLPNG